MESIEEIGPANTPKYDSKKLLKKTAREKGNSFARADNLFNKQLYFRSSYSILEVYGLMLYEAATVLKLSLSGSGQCLDGRCPETYCIPRYIMEERQYINVIKLINK